MLQFLNLVLPLHFTFLSRQVIYMCVCVCIYIYICMYIYIYIYIYIYAYSLAIHIHVCVCLYTWCTWFMYVCTFVHIYVRLYWSTYTHAGKTGTVLGDLWWHYLPGTSWKQFTAPAGKTIPAMSQHSAVAEHEYNGMESGKAWIFGEVDGGRSHNEIDECIPMYAGDPCRSMHAAYLYVHTYIHTYTHTYI